MDGERKKRTLRRQQFVGLKRIAHAIDTFSVGAFDPLNWRRRGLKATVVPITSDATEQQSLGERLRCFADQSLRRCVDRRRRQLGQRVIGAFLLGQGFIEELDLRLPALVLSVP